MSDPDHAALSRRQAEAARKQEQILDAAARLFAERGFHRTTTKDIALAADVSEGTLYNYFDNKNDLLFSILERLGEYELPADWKNEPQASGAREFMVQMLGLRRSFVEQNAVMLQAIVSEILANAELRRRYSQQMIAPTLAALEQDFQARAERGQLIADIDAPASARLIISLYVGLFILQVLGDPLVKNEWERLVDSFIHMVFDGLSPHKETGH